MNVALSAIGLMFVFVCVKCNYIVVLQGSSGELKSFFVSIFTVVPCHI